MKYNLDIPKPTTEEVTKWLNKWNNTEDIAIPENTLNHLFNGEHKKNDSLENVLVKCTVLNHFYSTNIFKMYPVAKHILSLNIDNRLTDGDPTLVEEIAKVTIGGKEKNFYSFASKYCSRHNPESFPIYDSYVVKVLKYYRDVDKFSKFTEADLKSYERFKKVLIEFKEQYHLNQFNLKELDMFLWQFGKKYFPNKY